MTTLWMLSSDIEMLELNEFMTKQKGEKKYLQRDRVIFAWIAS